MKYCKKCITPNTRPGITFDENGVCEACQHFDNRKNIDWDLRWKQLVQLCKKHKCSDNYYDCLITVSGGKDSVFQVGLFKEQLNMNPLCIMLDNGSWTQTGIDNFYNLSERFGVDILRLTLNRKVSKLLGRKGFEQELKPCLYWDRALYVMPLQMALKLNIPLVIWGDNASYERGGFMKEDIPDALIQLRNGMIKPEPLEKWCENGISMQDLQPCVFPSINELKQLDAIFCSYYIPWNTYEHVFYAIRNGFKTLEKEWKREGMPELDFQQIDTIGYLINGYCKFVKFGIGNLTEVYSILIREGIMTREKAVKLANENEWKVDPKMLADFCKGIGIYQNQFWSIIDKFANRDILKKDKDGYWKLKEAIR